VSYLDGRSAGDLVSRFTGDVDLIADGILQTVLQLVTGVSTVVGCAVMMIVMDTGIALAIIVVAPLAVLVSYLIAKNAGAKFRENQRLAGEFTGYVNEVLENKTIVKAFGYAGKTEERAGRINAELYAVGQKAQFYSSLVNPSTRLIANTTYVLIGLIGGLAAVNNGLSVAVISSLVAYSLQFSRPFNQITSILSQIQLALAAADRFFNLLAQPSEEDESRKPDLVFKEGAVEFRNVNFRYRADVPLREDFSLTIPPRAKVAIVGHTGAGKSTLINLLMRFYETDGGGIFIDGTDISTVNRNSVRACFSTVPQDARLFSGTVAENIAFGAENAEREEIEAAAITARADDFIRRTPNGYGTAAEDESGFSQGEKQLLTIARAVLKNAPMLIFDEATSNIDTHTEQKIQRAMDGLCRERTSFIIAHRLSTVADADLIIVMQNGAIAETGTHDGLMLKNGIYKELYDSQFLSAGSNLI
jgi:ABC-type multidrug transport system fused ATPase/permease subunit